MIPSIDHTYIYMYICADVCAICTVCKLCSCLLVIEGEELAPSLLPPTSHGIDEGEMEVQNETS